MMHGDMKVVKRMKMKVAHNAFTIIIISRSEENGRVNKKQNLLINLIFKCCA